MDGKPDNESYKTTNSCSVIQFCRTGRRAYKVLAANPLSYSPMVIPLHVKQWRMILIEKSNAKAAAHGP